MRFHVVALLALLALLGTNCSQEKKAIAGIEEAFERKDYAETVALCKLAVRNGIDAPEVHYYRGAALVHLGRDFEAFRQFAGTIRRDPTMSTRIRDFMLPLADADLEAGNTSRGARRLKFVYELDPGIDLGERRFAVAALYKEEKAFDVAAREYQRALDEYPDYEGAEEALYEMAQAYSEVGLQTRARETLAELMQRFPRGSKANEAKWQLDNLIFEEAEKQYVLGNHDDAVALGNELIARTKNVGLIQRTHFLLGEAYEAKGDFQSAYNHYRDVIRGDRGASGSIVERARSKIAEFQEAGLF